MVPVPLHPWRRIHRGFNQAADLAHTLGAPVMPILWRRRVTAAQAGLTAAERRRNVHRAFGVSPLMRQRHRDALRGAIVVLVDDVRTTGATLHACAEVLAGLGAREVRALTAAVRAQDIPPRVPGLVPPPPVATARLAEAEREGGGPVSRT
jgi:predicted amidophosphoribosyltransferase